MIKIRTIIFNINVNSLKHKSSYHKEIFSSVLIKIHIGLMANYNIYKSFKSCNFFNNSLDFTYRISSITRTLSMAKLVNALQFVSKKFFSSSDISSGKPKI